MRRSIFKRCLHLIDSLEINQITVHTLIKQIEKELKLQNVSFNHEEILDMIQICIDTKNISLIENGVDLSQVLTIYAKSRDWSETEALALFESMLKTPKLKKCLVYHLDHSFQLTEFEADLNNPFFFELIQDTILIENYQHHAMFNPTLKQRINWILNEYKSKPPVISDCTRASFTHDIYKTKKQMEMRNTDLKMIHYKNKDVILSILPRMGIPVDRDHSKDLQSFFKDCLFNEFNHRCAICQIGLPQLMIASHIKPFRDCAHVYEAMDNNNGLLLCRNHDYLFDQGYISFNNDGSLMICRQLREAKSFSSYMLNPDLKLSSEIMTQSRKEFLKYHRKNYFKDH